jgi:SAM-dependent methyltransferase
MLSDGTPIGIPVVRLACRICGAAWLPQRSANRLPRRLFAARYALNAGAPTMADQTRQQGYAERIARLTPIGNPGAILDVGCGNGALLLALARHWPRARLAGVEPAHRAAAAARAAGLRVVPTLTPGQCADLVISVNVIEHVIEPVNFLRALRRAVSPGGAALVVCPDGSTPWLELLMADHRRSLTPGALAALANQAGFTVAATEPSSDGFQAIVLRPSAARRGYARPFTSQSRLVMARRGYLARWRTLDGTLLARFVSGRRLICFGVGEAARLIRVYAPATWARVAAVTADDAQEAARGAQELRKPVVALEEVNMATEELLLSVRPRSQGSLAARLVASGYRVVRWDDLVAA